MHNLAEIRAFCSVADVRLLKIYQDAQGIFWLFLGRVYNYHYGMPGAVLETWPDYIAVKPHYHFIHGTTSGQPQPGDLIPEDAESWAEALQIAWNEFAAKQGLSEAARENDDINVIRLPVPPTRELNLADN